MAPRPSAGLGRSAAGLLQTMLHRRRGIRWIAAGGAAVAVVMALSDDGSDGQPLNPTPAVPQQQGPADRLAPATRGVPVPVEGVALRVGDAVDVHAVLTGAAVAHGALVVDSGEEEAVVAVPVERVDAMVDALTTGGVILVLVPRVPLEAQG